MQKNYRSRRNLVDTVPPAQEFNWGEPLTEQHHEMECDINYVVARCVRDGVPLNGELDMSMFKDVSERVDLKEALIAVNTVNDMFGSLPLNIRKEFDYDAAKLIAFLDNPENYSEAAELGLVSPTVVVGEPSNSPQQTTVNDTSSTVKTD